MELFCKNDQRVLLVNFFRKNAPSNMFDSVIIMLMVLEPDS